MILSAIMLLTTMGFYTPIDVAASATPLQVGEYIQMGTYYDEPILWRCIAYYKITGYDDDGNPIVDATELSTEPKEGYLPLMLSDKVLCFKAFDASGDNASGSHGRGDQWEQRKTNGSNYWGDSNIRDWLNSSASAGDVIWSCGNPPDKEHLWGGFLLGEDNFPINGHKDGYYPYDKEAGFLHGFSSSEVNAIISVTQKQILDPYEYESRYQQYPENTFYCSEHVYGFESYNNYDIAFSELSNDKIFLLDVKQVSDLYQNFGANYFYCYATSKAFDSGSWAEEYGLKRNGYVAYWLRTPNNPSRYGFSDLVFCANNHDLSLDGVNTKAYMDYSCYGIRPAFYLNTSSAIFKGGSGTETDPYIVTGSWKSQYGLSGNELDADITGLSRVKFDKDTGIYDVNSFKLYITAITQRNIMNYDTAFSLDETDEEIEIKITLPNGFSFSNNGTEKIKTISSTVNCLNEIDVFLDSPSNGLYYFDIEITNSQGETYLFAHEISVSDKTFNEDIYRAEHNISPEYYSTRNLEQWVLQEDTPADILKNAADTSGLNIGIYTWDVVNKSLNTIDNPGKIIDYKLEEKDMYQAMIFEMFDCELENKKADFFVSNKGIKDFKSAESTIIGNLKDIYTYDQLKNAYFSPEQRKNLMSVIKDRFSKEYFEVNNFNEGLNTVFDTFEYTGNGYDIIKRAYNNCQIYCIDEPLKQILLDMYNETPSTNPALKEALFETKTIIESSEKEFMAEIAAGTVQMAGMDAAQYGIKKVWGEAKEKAYEACPQLALAHAIVKSGQFVSDTLFNSSNITEAYYKLNAVEQLNEVVDAAYSKQKNSFASNKTVATAKNYNSAVNLLGSYYSLDCSTSKGFASAMDNGAYAKAFNTNSTQELQNSIDNMEKSIKGFVNSANTNWIDYLEYDYPELYPEYEKNRDNYKVYQIHCPVDVYVFDTAGVLVAASEGNSIFYDGEADITIIRDGDQKTVYTYGDEYKVIYKATDNGTMDVVVNEFTANEKTATVNFNNIPLVKDFEYSSDENGNYSVEENYTLLNDLNDENVFSDYDSVKTSEKFKLNVVQGIILDNGLQEGYFSKGEKINIATYVPDECTFAGWESTIDDVVSGSAVSATVTMPEEDVTVTAQFVIPDYIKGDVNRDGFITDEDVTLLLKYLNGSVDLKYIQKLTAKMNDDNIIDIIDAITILSSTEEKNNIQQTE